MDVDARTLELAIERGLAESDDLTAPSGDPAARLAQLVAQGRLTGEQLAALRVEAGAPAPAAQRLGPYEILDELGRGGMGAVYRARDPRLQREVAVKVMIAGEHASPELLARFIREAQATARLGHHPHIVPVLDVGQDGGRHYIVMELVDGRPLDRLIDDGEVPIRRAARLAAQLADGVAHAHAHGILHRDIKPANVLVTRAGEARLTDFGLARLEGDESGLTRSGALVGTPDYMAPEQVRGDQSRIDVRTDVYAMGAVLFEMLTDAPPFGGSATAQVLHRVLTEPPRSPRRANPAVPRDLETICLKAIEKDPARRYPDAAALGQELRRWLDGEPIDARPLSRPARMARWARRRPAAALATVASVALAAIGIGLGVAWWQDARAWEARRERARIALELGQFAEAAAVAGALRQLRPHDAEARRLADEAEAGRARSEQQRSAALVEQQRAAVVEGLRRESATAFGHYRAAIEEVRRARADALAAQDVQLELSRGDRQEGADDMTRYREAERERRDALARLARAVGPALERAFGEAYGLAQAGIRTGDPSGREAAARVLRARWELEWELGAIAAAGATAAEIAHVAPDARALHPPATGVLVVETAPAAHAYLARYEPDARGHRRLGAEQDLGTTPLRLPDVPVGSYRLRLVAAGYRDVLCPVWVRPGEEAGTPGPIPMFTEEEIGAAFVYVPAGDVWIGDPDASGSYGLLWCRRRVPGYLLARFETTVGEWVECLRALLAQGAEVVRPMLPSSDWEVRGRPAFRLEHVAGQPVVRAPGNLQAYAVMGVTHSAARAYALWRSGHTGRPLRLPSELEWVRAARGADDRRFPWGDAVGEDDAVHEHWSGHPDPTRPQPRPPGAAPADESPFGVRDLGGSASEWCADWVDFPTGMLVSRGGVWSGPREDCSVLNRRAATESSDDLNRGVRLACDLPPR